MRQRQYHYRTVLFIQPSIVPISSGLPLRIPLPGRRLPDFICLGKKSGDPILLFWRTGHPDLLPGVIGLTAFTAERRFKEIGIRKVLGATVSGVVLLLSVDFLKLILVAVLIAFPLAGWVTNKWLHGFAYRTSIGAGVFLVAGSATLLITMVTISFQAVKAALANPVKSLKAE